MAKVLQIVDIIYCLPIDFYGYNFTFEDNPYKISNEKNYIKHFHDVFEILKDLKFVEICLEYEKHMYEFFIYQKLTYLSETLDQNIISVFGKNSKFLTIYELKFQLIKNEKQIEHLQNSYEKQKILFNKLKMQNEDYEKEIKIKERVICDMMHSNSWKYTKTFRKIGNLYRNLKK